MMAIIHKYDYSLVHIRCKIPEVICKGLGAIDTNLVSTSFPLDISEYDFRTVYMLRLYQCEKFNVYFILTFGLVNFINTY